MNRNRIIAGLIALVVIVSGVAITIAGAPTASAHDKSITATCSSLKVLLSHYAVRDGRTNTIRVIIDGSDMESTPFGESYYREFQMNPYLTHTWSVDVNAWDNDAYDVHKTGTTTPCERQKPPQPPQDRETRGIIDQADCSKSQTYQVNQARYRDYSFDSEQWEWVPNDWSAWENYEYVLIDNPAYPCPKPPVVKPPTKQHADILLGLIDRCRCKWDNVKVVRTRHLSFVSVRQVGKAKWKIRVVASPGWDVAKNIRNPSAGYASSATYMVRTTNKPCPCEHHGCKPKPKRIVLCACKP